MLRAKDLRKVSLLLLTFLITAAFLSSAASADVIELTNGRVESLDLKANTLTLRVAGPCPTCAEKQITFVLKRDIRVLASRGYVLPSDIRVGEDVAVAYHNVRGTPVLDRVALDVPSTDTRIGGITPEYRFSSE